MTEVAVVVPWHNQEQRDSFLSEWQVATERPEFLVLQHDANGEGCAATKNKGVARAVAMGAEVVVVLDDDCYPDFNQAYIKIAALRGRPTATTKPSANPSCVRVGLMASAHPRLHHAISWEHAVPKIVSPLVRKELPQ